MIVRASGLLLSSRCQNLKAESSMSSQRTGEGKEQKRRHDERMVKGTRERKEGRRGDAGEEERGGGRVRAVLEIGTRWRAYTTHPLVLRPRAYSNQEKVEEVSP